MDRIATLRRAARELQSSIFRSLPWAYRVAHFFKVLSSNSIADAFNRAFSAVYAVRGLKGTDGWITTPLREGTPADQVRQVLPKMRNQLTIGTAVYGKLSRQYNPEIVQDAMIEVAAKFTLNPELIEEEFSVKSANSFVFTAVKRQVLNLLRKKTESGSSSLFDDEDESGDLITNYADPKTLDSFDEILSDKVLSDKRVRAIKKDVGNILPWAPDYIDMLLDGFTDIQMIGDIDHGRPSMLAEELNLETLTNPKGQPMTKGMWSKPGGWKDKIFKAVIPHLMAEIDEKVEPSQQSRVKTKLLNQPR